MSDLVVNAEDALRLIRPLGRDNLGVVLDSGHIHLAGESGVEQVDALGPLLYQVHLNDNDGRSHQGLISGDGASTTGRSCRSCTSRASTGSLVELSWDYSVDPEPCVARSATRVKEWMERRARTTPRSGRLDDGSGMMVKTQRMTIDSDGGFSTSVITERARASSPIQAFATVC